MVHGVFSKAWSFYSQSLVKRPLITKGLTAATCFTISDAFNQHRIFSQNKSQYESQYEYQHDYKRSMKCFIYGVCILGPTLHYWFKALDKIVPNVSKVNSLPLPKIHLDKIPSPFKKSNHLLLNGLTRGSSNSFIQYSPHTINLQWLEKFSPQRLIWSGKRVLVEQSSYALLMSCVYFMGTTTLDFMFDSSSPNKQSLSQRICALVSTFKHRISNEFVDYHKNGLKIMPLATFFNFLLIPPMYRGFALNIFNVWWNASQWIKSK